MDNFGNFQNGSVREVVVRDNDGKEVCIKLEYSGQTPLCYKNLFNRDMFADIMRLSTVARDDEALLQRCQKIDTLDDLAEQLSDEEIERLSGNNTEQFFVDFTVALIASAIYPERRDYNFIRKNMLPQDFITDERYSAIFDAAMSLFQDYAQNDFKKKLVSAARKIKHTR